MIVRDGMDCLDEMGRAPAVGASRMSQAIRRIDSYWIKESLDQMELAVRR